jgi:hypothetical protein
VELLKDIGAIAGLAAFLGLALMSLLFFSQARDLRRLRDWAGRAPERDTEFAEATSEAASERAEEMRAEDQHDPEQEARQAQQVATEKRDERRQRREMGLPEVTRAERVRERFANAGTSRRRMPEGRYIAVVIGGVIVLGAIVAVLALSVFSGGGGGGGGSKSSVPTPNETEVSILNATSVSGLATQVGTKVENKGYRLGAVTNSPSTESTSVVMFKRGHAPEAKRVAKQLGINKARLMSNEIAQVAAGSDVAVVVGEDMSGLGGSG